MVKKITVIYGNQHVLTASVRGQLMQVLCIEKTVPALNLIRTDWQAANAYQQ